MSDVVIRAENLGKSYRIAHTGPRERYTSLRDVVAAQARQTWDRLRRPFRPAPPSSNGSEEFWALRDVSFEIKRGEVVGIIGRNGAGKSTLLKILSRITEPTKGRVTLRGRVASLLEVGTGFHPELTGRENIYLNGAILGMTRAEISRKFDEIVDFAGVEKFLDTPVKRYSSGMYVRLAFAVAAHLEPEILVVDEVLAVGDAEFQKKCLGKMEEVASHGRTVLFVSHNLAAVGTLCNRGIFLSTGILQYDGPVSSTIDRYVRSFAQAGDTNSMLDDDNSGYTLVSDSRRINARCGEGFTLSADVTCPHPIESATFGVVIFTNNGSPVMGASSKFEDISGHGRSNKWSVHCSFTNLPISPGHYRVSAWFGDRFRDCAKFSDAFSINVVDHVPPGLVMPIPRGWGHFYWRPTWEISHSDCARTIKGVGS